MTSFPLMLMAAILLMTSEPGSSYRTIACEGSEAYLNCGYGSFISVHSATYGRRDRTTCSSGQPFFLLLNTGCSGYAGKVAQRCNGKHCCAIRASNWEFGDPCFGTHKYLDVTYTCESFGKRSDERYSVTCENSVAHLKCGEGQVLSIHRADYGRYDRTTCTSTRPSLQTQNTCCSLPNGQVAQRCNGRRSCSFTANNWEFGDPCWGTYKYLDVVYSCEALLLDKTLKSKHHSVPSELWMKYILQQQSAK